MSAKAKISATSMHIRKSRVKRPGVHAKSKTSSNKTSKNYVKSYCSQGK
jgi:hypothetical protein